MRRRRYSHDPNARVIPIDWHGKSSKRPLASSRKQSKCPTRETQAAVALSKLGASKGGQARAASLSPAKRRAIAKKAVAARLGQEKIGSSPNGTYTSSATDEHASYAAKASG